MPICFCHAAVVTLIGALLAACDRQPMLPPTPRTPFMDVTGTLEVDGHPVGDVAMALVSSDGSTVAVAQSDAAGRFTLPAGVAFGSGWVVAKLHAPVIGGVAAPVAADRDSLRLSVSTADAMTLTLEIELPEGAAPVSWFDVAVTPTSQDGVPSAALSSLTLDAMGPARSVAFHKARLSGATLRLRVLPGTYDVRVAHVVDDSKRVPPVPPNWVGTRATLGDGRVLAADLDHISVDVRRDVELRVALSAMHE
jgi:hypothetical protein